MKDSVLDEVKTKIGSTVEQMNKWYEEATNYQNYLGLARTIPECVRFYEGDQWAKVAKGTETFPRPVINIVKMIVDNKKAQVLSSPVKIVYKDRYGSGNEFAERFNRFAQYQQTRLQLDRISDRAILDNEKKGNWCLYFFWDKEVVGVDGLKEGDIGVQLVDPYDVKFSNPLEKDIQKQEWIILVSRESVEKVKEIADIGVDKSLINPDDGQTIYADKESDTTKLVTVLTRFFRHEGEVYYERSTQAVMFNEARPLTPNAEEYKAKIDGKEPVRKNNFKNKFIKIEKATKYPIVFDIWNERDKSIYGKSEVEAMIPNQKAINWTLGLQILTAQNEGMGAIIVKAGALKGQKITNEPGQIITDYYKAGKGIDFLNRPSMNTVGINLVDKLADLTRVVNGGSEIMSGELVKSGMSGAAIAQLQAQALKPIENYQKKYWRAMERVGEVLEQFLKFFYKGKKYYYRDKNDVLTQDVFDSSVYKNASFDVTAEAVTGTVMSEVADINVLENLLAKGAITNKQFIKCYPDNALSIGQKLTEVLEENESSQINMLSQQIKMLEGQLAQSQQQLQKQEQIIQNAVSIVNENRTIKEKYLALQAEYTGKIETFNKLLVGIANKSREYKDDATSFAEELAKARGINM